MSELYEHKDMNPKAIGLGIAAIIGGILISYAVVSATAKYYEGSMVPRSKLPRAPESIPDLYPRPRLETQTGQTSERIEMQQLQMAKSYGWVDKTSRHVRIPIEEAMNRYMESFRTPNQLKEGSKP